MLADLSDFIARLWTIAGEALRLNPDVLMPPRPPRRAICSSQQ